MRAGIKNPYLVCAVAVLALAWLKELSQRLAREEADSFMGPLLNELTYDDMRFTPFMIETRTEGKSVWSGPQWCVEYDSHKALISDRPEICVFPFGKIRAIFNLRDSDKLLGLSQEERYLAQSLMIHEMNTFRDRDAHPEKGGAGARETGSETE